MSTKRKVATKRSEGEEAAVVLGMVRDGVAHLESCVRWADDMGVTWAGYAAMTDLEMAEIAGRRTEANVLQRRVVRAVEELKARGEAVRIVAVKGRRSACSTICAKIVDLECRLAPGTRALQMGDEYDRSAEVFNMTVAFAKSDVYPWGFGVESTAKVLRYGNGPVVADTGKRGYGFEEGGSEVVKETAKDVNAGRGGGFRILHFTEVAHYPDVGVRSADKLMLATLNTVPKKPGTIVMAESTGKGRAGWFYRTWRRAQWPDWETYWRKYDSTAKGTAISAEDEDGTVWVRVFAAWYEIPRNAMVIGSGAPAWVRPAGYVHPDDEPLGSGPWVPSRGADFSRGGPGFEEGAAMWRSLKWKRRRKEREGMSRFGWTLEQIKWRRWTIANDLEGKEGGFEQEFPSTPEEAFRLTGAVAFSSEALGVLRRSAEVAERGGAWKYGALEVTGSEDGRGQVDVERLLGGRVRDLEVSFRPTPAEEAWLKCIEPPREGCRYVVCCDPASGKDISDGAGDLDNTSVLVVRAGEWVAGKGEGGRMKDEGARHYRRPRVVCRILKEVMGQRPADTVFFWMLSLVCRWYGNALLVVETNKGEWVLVGARRAGLNLYRERILTSAEARVSSHLGLTMTEETRHTVITRLQGAVHGSGLGEADEEERAEGRSGPDGHSQRADDAETECVPEIEIEDLGVVEEMEVFVRNPKGRFEAASGKHDDDVLCLGLGLHAIEGATKLRGRARRRNL